MRDFKDTDFNCNFCFGSFSTDIVTHTIVTHIVTDSKVDHNYSEEVMRSTRR